MLPKTVNILGLDYKIKEVEQVSREDSCYGLIFYDNQEILVDKSLSEEKKKQVLFHEIVHGIFEQLGYTEENENEHLVQSLAISLHQILKQLKG